LSLGSVRHMLEETATTLPNWWMKSEPLLLGIVAASIMLPVLVSAHAHDIARLSVAAQLAAGQERVTIVCFGDSTTGVYYHTGGRRAWCDMLGLALQKQYPLAKIEMVNAGVSGETTFDAVKRVQLSVLAKGPRLVVIDFLLNDVVTVSPRDYHDNLIRIIKEVRTRGAEVILCTPNSISLQDPGRPVVRVEEYVKILRRVGADLKVPVADCYLAFEKIRSRSAWAWMRLMDDAIHPNIRGHILVANEVTRVITGRPSSLVDVPPLFPSIPKTLSLLSRQVPVRVLAMPPYDRFVERAVREISPSAHIIVTPWAIKSLVEVEAERKKGDWPVMWKLKEPERPDLVIVAMPRSSTASNCKQFQSYNWMLGTSMSFAGFGWDVVPVLPSVTDGKRNDLQSASENIAVEAIKGHDLDWIARNPDDSSDGYEIFSRWLRAQTKGIPNRMLQSHVPSALRNTKSPEALLSN
jgi:acyl-CoA thioesterase I